MSLRNRLAYLALAAVLVGLFPPATRGDARSDRATRRTPVVEAYERVRDSVVNISTTEVVEQRYWGVDVFGFRNTFTVPRERTSVGSGFVIHENGYIATNAHVVSAGAQLTVTFADGSEYEARIIGRDTAQDLAVIKIDAGRPLKPITLGSSEDLMIGERTVAIGNPVGLQNTVTTGVISALHRELAIGGRVVYQDVIQTDASINPGNSGGPLLNILGELIGVNTAIRGDAQNIGFAIPVDQLREMLPEILDSEKRNNVQIGMRVSGTQPARVLSVREGSPADRAGVRLGDIVEAVDGQAVRQPVDFHVAMLERQAGDRVRLRLNRNGVSRETRMDLVPVPTPDGRKLAFRHFGLTIADVKDRAAERFRWSKQGVIVVAVEPKSPADREDIQPGDLLVSMGPYFLDNVDHVGTLLEGLESGDRVDVGFRRWYRRGLFESHVRLYAR